MSVENGTAPTGPQIPEWVKGELFEQLLKDNLDGYKAIKNFKALPALAAGENYATLMLRVEIEAELIDGKTKSISYMMKLPHESEAFKEMMKTVNIFESEYKAYTEAVPDMERLYKEAGINIKFGAKIFKLNTDKNYILLEDLRPAGFKNANRLEGLDIEHTKCVLKKMAQWHAASAVKVETVGKYPDIFVLPPLTENSRELMKSMTDALYGTFVKCMKYYEGHELYSESIEKLVPNLVDLSLEMCKPNPIEFNVLNHGDCWTNNIMFQYDAFGKIKETYFVDLQMPKYGTPAQDLFYFLLSSTSYDIKLKQFEYLIKYYHDNLIENLTLLKYPKKLPTLREIHIALYKYGVWGFMTVAGVLAAVLLDPTDTASFDNFFADSDDGMKFKMLMYTNSRYRKHCEVILPWLYKRGALEY